MYSIELLGDGWAPAIVETEAEWDFIREADTYETELNWYWIGGTTSDHSVIISEYSDYIPDAGNMISEHSDHSPNAGNITSEYSDYNPDVGNMISEYSDYSPNAGNIISEYSDYSPNAGNIISEWSDYIIYCEANNKFYWFWSNHMLQNIMLYLRARKILCDINEQVRLNCALFSFLSKRYFYWFNNKKTIQ